MSIKLIGRIINSECFKLIKDTDGLLTIEKQTKPLFLGDVGTNSILHVSRDEATARNEFKLICEAAQQYGRG